MLLTLNLSAFGLALLGSASLYLASPNQQGLANPLTKWPARLAGYLLLLASLWLFSQSQSWVTAVFIWSVCNLFLLILWPYLAAWRVARRVP